MKTTAVFAVSICLVLGLLAGCTPASDLPAPESPISTIHNATTIPADTLLTVYTSFYPMYDFARKIGGDKVDLRNMVPPGAEPHDWEPTPALIAGLEVADVFVYNGGGMEHWVDSVLGVLQNQSLVVVEASVGIPLLGYDHDDHDDDHGHDDHVDHGHHHHHGEADAHVWLNPMYAKLQMEAIRNAFVQADPGNKEYYDGNYNRYTAELDQLDAEFREALSPLTNRTIVVAHEAFGHLCDAYNLTQLGVSGLQPDVEPSTARMAQIIDFVKANNISVIFFEELANPKVAEAIARETGARVAVLSPLECLTDAQLAAGDDYFSVMRQNLEALKDALQ